MSFVTPEFLAFFTVVLALYSVLTHRWQNVLLLVASAVFYGWEEPWYVALLYAATAGDFLAGLAMERWPGHKRLALTVSIVLNLGLLAWFKYAGLFATTLQQLGVPVAIPVVPLPAGISFYTFQTMSYTIDVYRGERKPSHSPLHYFTFVSFFPHLVAGPIMRAPVLLAQVEHPRTLRWERVGSGLALATLGAVKKLVIADNVAVYVDRLFGLPHLSLPLALAGAFAFAVQILADFSGYTDMARGLARTLGFDIPPNFLHPYLAANPREFWQRWHVSFSSWIRDYLYIPLGGSRGGPARVAAVTLATMGISGLWHGASWNFALWGIYHGILIVVHRRVQRWLAPIPRILAVPSMFVWTVFGWLLFRQHDGASLAWTFTHPLPAHPREEAVVAGVVAAVGAAGGAALILALLVERHVVPRLGSYRLAAGIGFVSLAATATFYWMRTNADAFIYFRF